MKGIMKVNKKYFLLFFIFICISFLFGCNGVTPTGYTITATSGIGGSISPSGALMVSEGSNQSFIIIPDEGYEIADVLVDGTSEGVVTSYTFANIQQDHTIQVSFIGLGVYNTHIGLYYYTIQEAIDAALDGETILVYPGTYEENILFDAKNIIVKSNNPSDSAIVSTTIIDGGGNDSVVKFTGGDTSTLKGFTIQGGNAINGGGIHVYQSSPTITDNTITGNTAENDGGGIEVIFSSPTIANNTINGNTAASYGGGIDIYQSSPTITDNTITSNESGEFGGGIYISGGSPTITNNEILGNTTEYKGGGIYVLGDSSPVIGGMPAPFDTSLYNTICGNSPDQIEPNNYPDNYITTICMAELSF